MISVIRSGVGGVGVWKLAFSRSRETVTASGVFSCSILGVSLDINVIISVLPSH